MAPTRRLAILLACSAIALALAGGPGTVALFSDAHVAAGNISADEDVDRTTTVDAIGGSENTSANGSAENGSGDADAENVSAGTGVESTNETAGAENGSTNETTGSSR